MEPPAYPEGGSRRPERGIFRVSNGEGGIRTLEAGFSPPNALAGRRLQPLGHFSGSAHRTARSRRFRRSGTHEGPRGGRPSEAERAGFEPATRLSAGTRFPVALLRPLGHLSGRPTAYRRRTRRLGADPLPRVDAEPPHVATACSE